MIINKVMNKINEFYNYQSKDTSFDELTKCYKKEALYEKIEEAVNDKKEFILLKIDIDDFSDFNNRFGHMLGDMILIEISTLIKSIILNNGYVARTGGDEFTILLFMPNDYESVRSFCVDLRFKISTVDGSECIQKSKFTATLGCAMSPKDGNDIDTLISKTNKALFRGKNKGKNCSIIYDEEKHGEILIDDNKLLKDQVIDTYDSTITNYNIIYGITDVLNKDIYIKFDYADSLSFLGNFFMADRVLMALSNPDDGSFENVIAWNNPLYPSVQNKFNQKNMEEWLKLFDSSNTLIINDIESCKDLFIYNQLKQEKTKSTLAFKLIHEEKVYGLIRFDMIQNFRTWQQQKILSLSIISKIYSMKIAESFNNIKHFNELYIDNLTGLSNYSKWLIDIKEFAVKNTENSYSIITFEICDYVSLLSIIGSKKCEQLIIKISNWLKEQEDDITCRMRGEMFAILTLDADIDSLKNRARSLLKYISSIDNNFSAIKIRGGIYIADSHDDINTAAEKSRLALSACQNNEVLVYTDKLYEDIKEEKTLELHIEDALLNDEFMLYLQPKISTKTGKIEGAEALTRWNYMHEKILAPYKFIPLFERKGYITKLDFKIFEYVCIFLRNVIDSGKKPVKISVNVSRYTLDYENYIKTLNEIRNKYNISINLIELEITEGMYTENTDDIQKFVNMLKKEGYSISIDDFGSGYSNLNSIANLDFDVIKLDKSLCNMEGKNKDLILDAIISIAKKTGHKVVCEGIETKEMVQKMANLGADLIQGYYYDKPLEKEEFRNKYIE